MKTLTIDRKDYNENAPKRERTAVRGIVKKENSYLIIHGKYGDYKFPGGGRKEGESLMDTLSREVQEETGYLVKLDTVKEGIKVLEKRKGQGDSIMEMVSYYYFCEVNEKVGERNLDDYEEEYEYQVEWLPLEEILKKNEQVKDFSKIPWVPRETMVMKTLFTTIDNIC